MTWLHQAACRHHDTETFWVGLPTLKPGHARLRRHRAENAIAICNSCPVITPCKTDALRAGYFGYVAGGLLPEHQGPHDWLRTLLPDRYAG
jgi:hypothetical protein